MTKERYRISPGAAFNLHLHLVWCPKYRKPVLIGEVQTRLKQLLAQKAEELAIEIEGMEVMPEHVHLFVAVLPTGAPQFYANQVKGFTSRILRQEFPHLKNSLPSLWSRSYDVGSAGHVSSAAIENYIANQRIRS